MDDSKFSSSKKFYCSDYKNSPISKGFTFLMWIIKKDKGDKNHKLIKEYIKLFPNSINNKNEFGWTPLMIALSNTCKTKSFNIIETLLKYENININLTDNNNENALTKLIRYGNSQTSLYFTKKLINMGIAIDIQGENQRTSLMYCAKVGEPDILEILISKNIDINVTDNKGDTAIMKAAKMLKKEKGEGEYKSTFMYIISYLIKEKANLTIKNMENKSFFDIIKNIDNSDEIISELFTSPWIDIKSLWVISHEHPIIMQKIKDYYIRIGMNKSIKSQLHQQISHIKYKPGTIAYNILNNDFIRNNGNNENNKNIDNNDIKMSYDVNKIMDFFSAKDDLDLKSRSDIYINGSYY